MENPYDLSSGEPTQDERTLAMLAHLLQIFTGFIGPLVIFLAKRELSRYVAFHALNALLWQVAFFVLSMGSMFLWFCTMIGFSAAHSVAFSGPPTGMIVLFPLMFLFIGGGSLLNLVFGVVYAIKAQNGEWAGYPIIGTWASRHV